MCVNACPSFAPRPCSYSCSRVPRASRVSVGTRDFFENERIRRGETYPEIETDKTTCGRDATRARFMGTHRVGVERGESAGPPRRAGGPVRGRPRRDASQRVPRRGEARVLSLQHHQLRLQGLYEVRGADGFLPAGLLRKRPLQELLRGVPRAAVERALLQVQAGGVQAGDGVRGRAEPLVQLPVHLVQTRGLRLALLRPHRDVSEACFEFPSARVSGARLSLLRAVPLVPVAR